MAERRSGVYQEDPETGKLKDSSDVEAKNAKYESKDEAKIRDSEKNAVEKWRKEFDKDRVRVESGDDIQKIAEKLQKARDRFLKAKSEVEGNNGSSRVEEFREIRLEAYQEYSAMVAELNRLTRLDFEGSF